MISGCESEKSSMPSSVTIDETPPSVFEQNESLAEPSLTDLALYDSAFELMDVTFCNKIVDPALRKTCQNGIHNQLVVEKAIGILDESICNESSSADATEACKIRVQIQFSLALKKQQFQAEVEGGNNIIATRKVTDCAANLKDPSVIQSCELTIIVSEAVKMENISLCDQASTEVTRKICRNDYVVLVANSPASIEVSTPEIR